MFKPLNDRRSKIQFVIVLIILVALIVLLFSVKQIQNYFNKAVGNFPNANTQGLINTINSVPNSLGYKYSAKDDQGNGLDTLKIIENPSGGYLGVYHRYVNNAFRISLAKSTDLLNWTFQEDLDQYASNPRLSQLSDKSYLLTYEKDSVAAVTCFQGLSDNFLGNTIDTSKWTSVGNGVSQSNGVLHMSESAGNTDQSNNISTINKVTGDFVVELDIPNLTITPIVDTGTAEMGLGGTNFGFHISLRKGVNGSNIIEANGNDQTGKVGVDQTATAPNIPVIHLKVQRSGTTLTTYYKDIKGNDVLLGTMTNMATTDISISLYSFSVANHPKVMAQFDNFSMHCASSLSNKLTVASIPSPFLNCSGLGGGGGNCIAFLHYPNLSAVLTNSYDKSFLAPRSLSACAEGTPNIISVTLSPDINNSTIAVGHHFNQNCYSDSNAQGTLKNFNFWSTAINSNLNNLFLQFSKAPVVGGRDYFSYGTNTYEIVESESVLNDPTTVEPYIYNYNQNVLSLLTLQTHGGSKAFSNPTLTFLTLPNGQGGYVSTEFVPSEAAAPGEGGELIYFGNVSSGTIGPSVTPVPIITPTLSPTSIPTIPPTECSLSFITGTGVSSCTQIKVYDVDWNLLNAQQLSGLIPGQNIYFTVTGSGGSFDKARFTINGVLNSDTTNLKPGSSREFYQQYIIPTGEVNFTINADLHDSTTNSWL